MPICFIEAPVIGNDAKTKLVEKVTAALRDAYHLRDYRVFIREYPGDNVAQDGNLQTEIRPVCFVEGPAIRVDIKSTLIEKMTTALSEVYHSDQVMIFLREHVLENVGINGRLQSKNPQVVEALQKLAA